MFCTTFKFGENWENRGIARGESRRTAESLGVNLGVIFSPTKNKAERFSHSFKIIKLKGVRGTNYRNLSTITKTQNR